MPTPAINDASSEYALPSASLLFLRRLVTGRGIERVFEFGSGQSTHLFLELGCETTSMEDSPSWLAETEKKLSAPTRARWRPVCQPLVPLFLDGAPLKGWALNDATQAALRTSQLVLIDSPAFPPFREHALVTALQTMEAGVIVVDDANIPTVSRFCVRLAEANGLANEQWPSDHGLHVITVSPRGAAVPKGRSIRVARGWWETIKAWRRYALA